MDGAKTNTLKKIASECMQNRTLVYHGRYYNVSHRVMLRSNNATATQFYTATYITCRLHVSFNRQNTENKCNENDDEMRTYDRKKITNVSSARLPGVNCTLSTCVRTWMHTARRTE
jgi:hypothetical protein